MDMSLRRPCVSLASSLSAIEFAKRGEPWRPSNVEEDFDALIAAQRALAR